MKFNGRCIIEGRYLQDILDQPNALNATFEKMAFPDELAVIKEQLHTGTIKRIVLTGMGSSFYILTPLYLALANHGYEVVTSETSELIYYLEGLLNRQSLIICVSQSGRSAEMIRLLEKNAGQAKLISITNSPMSPLARSSDAVLITHAGEEFSVSSKTYVAALLALEVLGGYLCDEDQKEVRDDLGQAASAVASYLDAWRQHVFELAGYLDGTRHTFFVGRGRSLAAAGTGALITKESVGVHAEGMSSAAFRHGPMEMLTGDTFVGVLEGDEMTRNLNEHLKKDIILASGRSDLIGPGAGLASLRISSSSFRILSILEILPLQMMTLALAYLSGTEAGLFTRATKVTITE